MAEHVNGTSSNTSITPIRSVLVQEKPMSQEAVRQTREAIAQAHGGRKLQLLLDADAPRQLVRSMPPQELLFTIKEIGLDDSAEIIQLADKEQITYCLDLDCWNKDRLDRSKLTAWLRYLLAGEFDAAERVLESLDVGLLIGYLQDMIKIHERPEDDAPNIPTENELLELSDFHYIIELLHPPESENNILARSAIRLFEMYGFEFYYKLFEAVRWSLLSDLEEQAYRFRNARLADWGFIDYYEALSIYRPLQAKEVEMPPTQPPTDQPLLPALRSIRGRGRFNTILQQIQDPTQLERLQFELLHLNNKAIIAGQIDPTEPHAGRQVLRSVKRMLELGLELATGDDDVLAAQLLQQRHLEWFFRKGYTPLYQLRRKAARLAKNGKLGLSDKHPFSLLDAPYPEVLQGLRQVKPRYHTGLDPRPGQTLRPFRSLEEVQRTTHLLDYFQFLPTLFFDGFGFSHETLTQLEEEDLIAPHDRHEIRFSHLFLTALANFALRQTFKLDPLSPLQVKDFLQQALQAQEDGPHIITPSFQQQVATQLKSMPNASEQDQQYLNEFLGQMWQRLLDETAYLDLETEPDPRFLDIFLITQKVA